MPANDPPLMWPWLVNGLGGMVQMIERFEKDGPIMDEKVLEEFSYYVACLKEVSDREKHGIPRRP